MMTHLRRQTSNQPLKQGMVTPVCIKCKHVSKFCFQRDSHSYFPWSRHEDNQSVQQQQLTSIMIKADQESSFKTKQQDRVVVVALGRKRSTLLQACIILSITGLVHESAVCRSLMATVLSGHDDPSPSSADLLRYENVGITARTTLQLPAEDIAKHFQTLDVMTNETPVTTSSYNPKSKNDTESWSSSSSSSSSSDCEDSPRRQPMWEWRKYNSSSTVRAKKRILIAQYSSYGRYARMIELTTPINKAYAKKWGHDFLLVQGCTLIVPSDGICEPPGRRAIFNKLEILRIALWRRNEYDQLLILDADAMMYDFARDVTELLPDEFMLVGHRVSSDNPEPITWDINNGITLWNLHHPMTIQAAKKWNYRVRKGVARSKEHGDQHYLHSVLKEGDLRNHVLGLPNEFFYERGTVAKHFIRTKAKSINTWNTTIRTDVRERRIAAISAIICKRFPADCEELEYNVYTN